MQPDRVEEWRRLTEHYREISDGELEELAHSFGDLTEAAQQILRDELRHRGLGELKPANQLNKSATYVPAPRLEASADLNDPDTDGSDPAGQFTWKTLLCETETRAEAWQIYEMLRRANIESWLETRGDTNPRVTVAADQLEAASAIAAQPVPMDIVEESTAPVEEFELPSCPRCGAEDPILENTDPVNAWRCESCDAEWTDPVAEADEETPGRRP